MSDTHILRSIKAVTNPTSVEREPEDIDALNLLHHTAVIAADVVV